ncbi:hypothetical protein Fcan01_26810 [Folsomia candida]|uniref:Uncharacterized protein n=1 Tax=Folsomia candida TaxID=158441 RepID=A0A226CZC5_FOLCA|nr:hypothetical protein Fcan01_26810 [Folsomia candida]
MSFAQLFVISTVLEKPTRVPHKLEIKPEFRVSIGCFALVSIILTNLYLGLCITSISAPLESKSVTQFHHLSKPGCENGRIKCTLRRLRAWDQYISSVDYHAQVFWQRLQYDEEYLKELYEDNGEVFPANRNNTYDSVRSRSIRKRDINRDFTLLPYSIELNASKYELDENDFCSALVLQNNKTATNILRKCQPRCKQIDSTELERLQLLDLLDPWLIPHSMVGNLSNLTQLKEEWDIEHLLVQCGKTALILREDEMLWEFRYFEKNYP